MRLLVLCFLIIYAKSTAQVISGYINDSITGEPLIGAGVYLQNGKGTISNSFGYYLISVKAVDTVHIKVSYIGYQQERRTIIVNKTNISLNFNLRQNTSIEEIKVVAKRSIQETPEMSLIEIPLKQIRSFPMLAGENDIMKALQLMPGVKSGQEGQSNLFVRGGSPDQNLVLLDDVPLYYVNHLGGFVSVFNTDVLNTIKLYKGGFPARYGSRLSSVTDIRMKNGNLNKHHQRITIGLISSKVSFEGPLKKDTVSYLISVRRFMYDLISRPVSKLTNNTSVGYTFYDINAKLNYKISHKDRLYFSFYSGDDKITNKKKEKDSEEKELMKNISQWGNIMSALRWNRLWTNKLFNNITVYYTRYRYRSDFSYEISGDDENSLQTFNFSSQINDIGLKSDFDYVLSGNYTLHFGSRHIYHTFFPNITSIKQSSVNTPIDTTFNKISYNAIENSLFLENDFNIKNILFLNAGLRFNSYFVESTPYIHWEPRLLFNLNLPIFFAIKSSYAVMTQNVHLLSYSGAGLPSDLWMPATGSVPPQISEQLALGLAKNFPNAGFEISIEAYYKNMYHLIDYKDGVGVVAYSINDWQQLIEKNGFGKSKGVEFLLQKKEGSLSGWIAYTLSKTTRQFENINHGKPYFYTYDATHDFSIVVNYQINNNLNISASWVYTTGRAITIPNEQFYIADINILNSNEIKYDKIVSSYYEKNNVRMKDYHRLDIGLTYTKQKKKSERMLKIGIYNLYNRQNAYYYYVSSKQVSKEKTQRVIYQRSLFPFIPSISYSFVF